MKVRLLGTIFVLAILAALYVLVGENEQHTNGNQQPAAQQQTEADPLKGLKIN